MQKCLACGSSRVYPSRARSIVERLRRIFSERQPCRCHACNHRTWQEIRLPLTEGPEARPDDLRTGLVSRPITSDELDRLDDLDRKTT